MCTLFSILLRATEQVQTYPKICVLVSHLHNTLFECAEQTFFSNFCNFQTLTQTLTLQGHRTEQSILLPVLTLFIQFKLLYTLQLHECLHIYC